MRNLKKVLCLVLSLAMMLSVMVVGSSAAFTDSKEIVNDTAVDMCVALHIINGYTDGSFRPTSNITRAEFSKMMCVMLNGGETPTTASSSSVFADVHANAAWAEGYVEYCYTKGIVAGVGGGNFNPNGNITATEAAKMLLVALGYNAEIERYVGADWALYVNVQANQDGLYKNLKNLDTSAALSRDNAAQMIWNTLQSGIVTKTSSIDRKDGSITDIYAKEDPKTATGRDMLEKAYNADNDHGGIMVGFDYSSSKAEWTYSFAPTANHAVITSIKSDVDYTDLFMQDVTVVYDKDNKDVYGMYVDSGDCQVLASGIVANIDEPSATATSTKISDVSYDFAGTAANIPVYFYGESASKGSLYAMIGASKAAEVQLDPFSFQAIDLNSNDKIDCIVVYPYAVGQISLLNATKVGIKGLWDAETINLTPSGTVTADLKDVDVYEGMAKNDYVIYTPDVNTATGTADISPVDSVISGSVSRVSGRNITIDGTVYKNIANETFAAGNKVTDVVLVGGYIFMVEGANSHDVDDYVVVCKLGADNYGSDLAKLLFADGTKQSVSLDSKAGVVAGKLYTYEKNSDGDYTLTAASTDASVAGFDVVLGNTIKATSTDKVKYIGGATIADDAVIFVNYDGDSYKVITGAQLKKTAATGMTVLNAYGSKNSSTGTESVDMAYVSVPTNLKSGNELYGYVVANPASVKNADNANVIELQIWNGSEVVTLVTDGTCAKTVGKRDIIKYTVNSDDEIDTCTVISAKGAITSYDASEPDVVINTAGTGRLSIDDKDTTVMYIDNDDIVGYTEGSIQIATQAASGGAYLNNCVYIVGTDGETLDLLVIDINNDLDRVL